MKYYVFALIASFLLNACCVDCDDYRNYDDVDCKKFNYLTYEALRDTVEIEEPREIDKAGKIYVYEDLLLVNEKNKGIHIIDNSDKKNPNNKKFIKLLGNLDIAVKDGYLYADSFMDLLVFDIRDMGDIKKVTRKEKVFPVDPYQVIDNDEYDFWYSDKCGFDIEKGIIVEVNND